MKDIFICIVAFLIAFSIFSFCVVLWIYVYWWCIPPFLYIVDMFINKDCSKEDLEHIKKYGFTID